MFRYRRIHTNVHANLFATYPAYEFHSFHANYKYSLCKLQPVPNFVYMLCIPFLYSSSNNLENHSKIYISLLESNENKIYYFLSIEVNIQSPFSHPYSKILLKLQRVPRVSLSSQNRFSV